MNISIKLFNDDDSEEEHELPAKYVVCGRCDGHGSHLTPSIGEHAYSAEEFNESFDDEEAQEYCTRGGIYDIQCVECKGNKVVSVVDETHLSEEQKKIYELFQKQEEERLKSEREDAAMRRAECGYGYEY